MEKILTVVQLVLALLPLIVEAVKKIEAAFPQGGLGDKKLSLLLQMLEESGNGVEGFREKFNEAIPTIQRVVGWTVSLFNAAGEFKK